MASTGEAEKLEAERDGGMPARHVELVVISGHSGAGKSEAIAAFEDAGYFCVDNLPPRMIGALGELFRHEGSGVALALPAIWLVSASRANVQPEPGSAGWLSAELGLRRHIDP